MILLAPFWTEGAWAQEGRALDPFLGAWEGQGKLFGTEATFSMEWEWVLEHKFVRLTFQNSMQSPDGAGRILKAQAFYLPVGEGRFEGTWFDSRGMALPLRAKIEQTTLTALWGGPETEQGRTVYRVLDEDRLEVTDFVWRSDQWQPFGHAIYGRVAKDH
jgi:hypothetical protein